MNVDPETITSASAAVIAVATAVHGWYTKRSVGAQLRQCAELDARVRGYLEGQGRRRDDTKRVKRGGK